MCHPAVSIIVPYFNGGKWLNNLAQNLKSQTNQNFELILVDDGSNEENAHAAEIFAQEHPYTILIRKENGGAGSARNAGIRVATGKFLYIPDIDDSFSCKLIEIISSEGEKHQAEVIIFNYEILFPGKAETSVRNCAPIPKQANPFHLKDLNYHFSFAACSCCNKAFLREFILKNNICCSETYSSNDLKFSLSSLFLANRIIHINQTLYTYDRTLSESITSTRNKTAYSIAIALEELAKVLKEKGLFENQNFLKHWHPFVLSCMKYNLQIPLTDECAQKFATYFHYKPTWLGICSPEFFIKEKKLDERYKLWKALKFIGIANHFHKVKNSAHFYENLKLIQSQKIALEPHQTI